MNTLPIYKLKVDTFADGVNAIALVEQPAIERNFVKFSAQKKQTLKIQNEERRIVSGPIMLADTPIYRNDENGEYLITIEKDEILKIVQKFFKQGNQTKTNAEHDPMQPFDGLVLFESFIIDESRGIKAPTGFEDLPEGSWFGSFKVDNDDAWKQIQDGTFLGFSIEGIFTHEAVEMKKKMTKTRVRELSEFFNLCNNILFQK